MANRQLDRRRFRRPIQVLLCATAAAVACAEEPAPAEPAARPVKIVTVADSSTLASFSFPGEISPNQNAEPAFEVPGKIIEFPVIEGQAIEAGAVIARLDPRDYEAGVEKAAANVKKAESDLERARILHDKGVSPLTDVESAERRRDVTLADLKRARKALDDSVLRAPFRGTVAKKIVGDFQNVQAKQPIVILQDETVLQIEVSIPERDFAGMTPGLTLEERTRRARPRISLNSIPGRVFEAWIVEFSTTADPATRTFKATFAFDPPVDLSIRPGMTAKVTLGGGPSGTSSGALSIPARAVTNDGGGEAFVWVIDPDSMRARKNPVAIGELDDDVVAVESGLTGGEMIAVSGVHQLRDGMAVRRYGK